MKHLILRHQMILPTLKDSVTTIMKEDHLST